MDREPCDFCGQLALGQALMGSDSTIYECPGCGRYVVDWKLEETRLKQEQNTCFRLACLLRERRLRKQGGIIGVFSATGGSLPSIKVELAETWEIDALLQEFPQPAAIADRALLNISRIATDLETVHKSWDQWQYLVFSPKPSCLKLMQYLVNKGLLDATSMTREGATVAMSPDGWSRVNELPREDTNNSSKAFVAMWFNNATAATYERGIAPAISAVGYEPVRIDNVEHNDKICDAIMAQIRTSRFVVADFTAGHCSGCPGCARAQTCTDKVRARGGVYFEAGFALGRGIPVIWLVDKSQIDCMHFDTRQYNHIAYETPEELRERLLKRIQETIR